MYVVMAVYVWNGVLPQEMTWLNSEQFNTLRFMAGGYLIGYFAAWAMHILETKR